MGPDPRAASQRRGKTPARCRPCCGVAGVMERSGLTLGVLRRGSPLVRFERHRALSRTSLVGRDKPCGWRVPLVAAHQLAIWSASVRSSCDSSPPIGETSRISMESRSSPVKTRWSPGTSPRSISDVHRSRLRICGWPVTLRRSRSRLCSMVGSRQEDPVRSNSEVARWQQIGNTRTETVQLGQQRPTTQSGYDLRLPRFSPRQIVAFGLSGGGSAGSNPAGRKYFT
jgi:hypothetical protein